MGKCRKIWSIICAGKLSSGKVSLGKCRWENVGWENVPMGNCRMGKSHGIAKVICRVMQRILYVIRARAVTFVFIADCYCVEMFVDCIHLGVAIFSLQ